MKVRVGVDAAVDDAVLRDFTQEAHLVRIAKEPEIDMEIDFWIPLLSPKIVQSQWQHLKGVRVVQAPWAGIGPFLEMLPSGVVLCDAQGVHDIPTAEWTLSAIRTNDACRFTLNCKRRENGEPDSRPSRSTLRLTRRSKIPRFRSTKSPGLPY